jgi:hypothetical protein
VRARLNILCALRLFGCASLLLAAVCAASPKWRQAAWSVEESSAPHFDSFIPATRCSCTAPCKEQAGNRESSSAPLFYIHRLVLRSCNRSGHRAPLSLSVMAGLVPAIHVFAAASRKDVDARQRRQVYAVCASLTALPGMTTYADGSRACRSRGPSPSCVRHPYSLFKQPISFPRRIFCARVFASLLRQAPIEG